jgi:ActR/RegA family two-component response regulator
LTSAKNLLIVEDDSEWRGIYARAAARQGVQRVKIAKELADAEELVDQMQFGVAFIDIALDTGDDRNSDGLRVMRKIRSVGDETSIVVITGRSGNDVLPITRESIMRYQAHNILGKAEITPRDIDEALKTGLEKFEKRRGLSAVPAQSVLKGHLEPLMWEDQMMRGTGVRHGVNGLYVFLDKLVEEYLPLIPTEAGAAVTEDQDTSVMHGPYWSRSTGEAVVICFAATAQANPQIRAAKAGQPLLGRYDVGATLKTAEAHGLSGAVFALNHAQRDSFAPA